MLSKSQIIDEVKEWKCLNGGNISSSFYPPLMFIPQWHQETIFDKPKIILSQARLYDADNIGYCVFLSEDALKPQYQTNNVADIEKVPKYKLSYQTPIYNLTSILYNRKQVWIEILNTFNVNKSLISEEYQKYLNY